MLKGKKTGRNSVAFTLSLIVHGILLIVIATHYIKEKIISDDDLRAIVTNAPPPTKLKRISRPVVSKTRKLPILTPPKAMRSKTIKTITTATRITADSRTQFALPPNTYLSAGLCSTAESTLRKNLMKGVRQAKISLNLPKFSSHKSIMPNIATKINVAPASQDFLGFEPDSISIATADLRGSSSSLIDFIAKIRKRITRSRRYGLSFDKGGTVEIRFSLDRQGNVVELKVSRTSGSQSLDSTAALVVRSASPFPSLPPDYPKDLLALEVPIVFTAEN